jgi:hypothetical protein
MKSTTCALALGLAVLAPAPALAGEVFLGGYAHAIGDGLSVDKSDESGAQVIGGYRTGRIAALAFLGKPNLHLLGAVNTSGGIDYAAAGFDWRIPFGDGRFFLRPGIGIAVHDGEVDLPDPYDPTISGEERVRRLADKTLDLGSRVLAELQLGLGFQATERLSLELSWEHVSHGRLAGDQNPGLSDVGVSATYRFGP